MYLYNLLLGMCDVRLLCKLVSQFLSHLNKTFQIVFFQLQVVYKSDKASLGNFLINLHFYEKIEKELF